MKSSGTVLIVDDQPNMRRVLGALIKRRGHAVLQAGDGQAALEVLSREPVDAVLTDLKMPHMNGLELLEAVRKRHPSVPIILLTAHGTVGSAVEALKCGAFDYLTKPFDPDEIQQVVDKAVRTHELQEAEASVRPGEDPDQLLLGTSPALLAVKHVTDRVAPTTATVLLTGESGTGKELVARRLHLRSDRSEGPFVKINCAAIPESLLESELFGHEKGAFTGAASRKPGRFELADGGTLFLDEIGEMPLVAQPKLLRAIQEGQFYRVGGTTTITVDVRLVAASNRELLTEVRRGRFREDLFYRLNVVPVRLPPLRERREDIPALVACFAERAASRLEREPREFSAAALEALGSRDWPGNIRELENAVERAVLLSESDPIDVDELPPEYRNAVEYRSPVEHSSAVHPPERRSADAACDDSGDAGPLRERIRSATRRMEREAIIEALKRTHGNVTQAARHLGLSRRGLQLKMKELGIERESR